MKKMRLAAKLALLIFALPPQSPIMAAPPMEEASTPIAVPPPDQAGSDIYPLSYEGDLGKRSLEGIFKGRFNSALVGRYLDEEPAQRLANFLHSRGLTAFVLRKKIEERRLLENDPVGDFYLVMAGLFGRKEDADTLGQRLRAKKEIKDYRIAAVDDPGELANGSDQNKKLALQSAKLSQDTSQRASQPLPPQSPVVTGEAFKNHVYGKYVGSYRDNLEAREHARRLTAAGWPASVESKGGWSRVFLAPTNDMRDLKAEPETLAAAKKSAANQPGLIFVADLSGLKGNIRPIEPEPDRNDASACAGYSEAGRLGTLLSRTIIYIPDTNYTVGLTGILPQPMDWLDIPDRVKAWWDNKEIRPKKKSIYGPAIFNRPEMEMAIGQLSPSTEQASLALGLTEASADLAGISGRKVILVYSEFKNPDQPKDVLETIERLRSAYGPSLELIFIYGDADAKGLALANDLSQRAGKTPAWDGCRLLADNAYFEKYIKTIFR